VMVQM